MLLYKKDFAAISAFRHIVFYQRATDIILPCCICVNLSRIYCNPTFNVNATYISEKFSTNVYSIISNLLTSLESFGLPIEISNYNSEEKVRENKKSSKSKKRKTSKPKNKSKIK